MRLTELWGKIKALSTISSAKDGGTPTPYVVPHLVDNKEVNLAVRHPEPGKACNKCRFFHLPVELVEAEPVPPPPQHDYDEEELINLVKLPIYFGYCSRFLPQAKLIYGVRSDCGCHLWTERLSLEQFDDNVIEGDDGQTPIVPKVLMEL